MTYREAYAQQPSPGIPPERVHLTACPADCPGNLECTQHQLTCAACWEREMEARA